MTKAIDASAQPVPGRTRRDLPEAARLFEKSGTAHLLDRQLTPVEIVARMDAAGPGRKPVFAGLRSAGL